MHLKRAIKKVVLFCALFLVSEALFAQQHTVTGTVSAADTRETLPGATIIVKGSTRGTTTNIDGQYSLEVSPEETLVFSFVGYQSQEIPAGIQRIINVTLETVKTTLTEVVVIGYGTQRKQDLTGSSVSMKGSDIAKMPAVAPTQALQGKAAGVQIVNSGAPGSSPNVRIRGTGSILGGVDPLYVVDGIITNDIRNINSADIVTMDVLKDASSTAIYGARAANGVVLITTKAGRKGLQVGYNGFAGTKLLTNAVDMARPNQFAIYSNEAAGAPAILQEDITGETDWYAEITRPGIFHNHALSLNGGSDRYKYYLSAGYLNENGILLGNNYERYTVRINHDFNITDRFKVGNTLALSRFQSINKPWGAFTSAYNAAPIYDAKNPDGTYGYTNKSDVGNPLAALELTNDKSWGYRPQGTLWGEYRILDGLSFRTSFGIDMENNKGRIYVPVYRIGDTPQKNEVSNLTNSQDSIYQWVWDNFFTYDKKFGEAHSLKFTLGHTAERRDGWTNRAIRKNVADNEDSWELAYNDTTGGQENYRDPIGMYFRRESYFGRANYSFMDKYLINATLRRDANSNFSEANRWGSFPAVGLGWVISNEPFFKNQKLFNEMKLRLSYGLVGNDVIGPGQFELRPSVYQWAYFGGTRIDGAIVTNIIDPNLKWEVVKEYDIGLEFSLFDYALAGEIDYYHKKASGALYTVPLVSLGFGGSFLTNAADIINQGVELSLRYTKDFGTANHYTLRANTSFNHNTVENIGLGKPLNYGGLNNGWTATQTREGYPIGSFWLFKTDGIFQNEAELNAYPHVENAKPGDFRIVDVNDDGIIDSQDRQHMGSYQPKATFGLSQNLTWGNFDASLDLYGVTGNKVYNAMKGARYGGNYNIALDIYKGRWTPDNPVNDVPRAFNGVPYPTDYFLEDGSYLKISDVSIGYNLAKLLKSERFDVLRIYFSAQNPYVLTKYSGFTPELPGNQNEAGIELSIYPIAASYMFGLNLQFK